MPLRGSGRKGALVTDRVTRWLDERTRLTRGLESLRKRVVPDHWSLLFGQIAVASFVICSLSGVFLMFFYDPSTTPVVYDGAYEGLRGVEMSRALESTVHLSLEVRGGLLMRQLHHWSASVMIAAVMLHLLRVFFTGAFRKPRELTWLLWFGILLAGMGAGLTGHILPDDALSGTSLMVMDGLLKGIPIIGTWLSALVFQGRFPTGAVDTFYPLHVLLLPAVIVVFLLVIGMLHVRHKPAQFRGPGRTEHNVVGRPFMVALVRSGGLFCIVFSVLTLIAATTQVNPVWTYGPADPSVASAGGGALWYLAFLDGAQRLVPPGWEFVFLDRTWTPAIFVPLAVGGLFFLTAMIYPFIERWIVGDNAAHHLLTRPRNAPPRTGIGVAGIVFYGVMWIAGGSDTIALHFSLGNEALIHTLQVAFFLWPVVSFILTKRICLGLQRKDREIALHGFETGRIIRSPEGEYTEVHRAVDAYTRWKLIDYETYEPLTLRPDEHGRIRFRDRLRVRLSRWFFEDRIVPPQPDEVAALDSGSSDPHDAGRGQAAERSPTVDVS